jgi:hypothetical protein
MAAPTPEELDRQMDDFIDKLVEDKDQLPKGELDDAFWKVRRSESLLPAFRVYTRI